MNSNNDRLGLALTSTSSRRQALKLMGGGLAMAAGIKGVAAKPERAGLLTDIPVTGVLENAEQFAGALTITSLEGTVEDGLFANGFISSEVFPEGEVGYFEDIPMTLSRGSMDSMKNKLAFAGQALDMPVGSMAQQGGGSCQILDLDLGPLHLDLLGLVVDLAPVQLDLTAERGPGNLLGNLLCAVAGLLDGGTGGILENLLARINELLGGL